MDTQTSTTTLVRTEKDKSQGFVTFFEKGNMSKRHKPSSILNEQQQEQLIGTATTIAYQQLRNICHSSNPGALISQQFSPFKVYLQTTFSLSNQQWNNLTSTELCAMIFSRLPDLPRDIWQGILERLAPQTVNYLQRLVSKEFAVSHLSLPNTLQIFQDRIKTQPPTFRSTLFIPVPFVITQAAAPAVFSGNEQEINPFAHQQNLQEAEEVESTPSTKEGEVTQIIKTPLTLPSLNSSLRDQLVYTIGLRAFQIIFGIGSSFAEITSSIINNVTWRMISEAIALVQNHQSFFSQHDLVTVGSFPTDRQYSIELRPAIVDLIQPLTVVNLINVVDQSTLLNRQKRDVEVFIFSIVDELTNGHGRDIGAVYRIRFGTNFVDVTPLKTIQSTKIEQSSNPRTPIFNLAFTGSQPFLPSDRGYQPILERLFSKVKASDLARYFILMPGNDETFIDTEHKLEFMRYEYIQALLLIKCLYASLKDDLKLIPTSQPTSGEEVTQYWEKFKPLAAVGSLLQWKSVEQINTPINLALQQRETLRIATWSAETWNYIQQLVQLKSLDISTNQLRYYAMRGVANVTWNFLFGHLMFEQYLLDFILLHGPSRLIVSDTRHIFGAISQFSSTKKAMQASFKEIIPNNVQNLAQQLAQQQLWAQILQRLSTHRISELVQNVQ